MLGRRVATVEDDELLEQVGEIVLLVGPGARGGRANLRHDAVAKKLDIGNVAQAPDTRQEAVRVEE